MSLRLQRSGGSFAIDDQPEVLASLQRLLRHRGFEFDCFTSPSEALRHWQQDSSRYDLLLIEVNMAEMNGLDLLQRARQIDSFLPAVMLSAEDRAETAVSSLKGGAFNYLVKPLDDPDAVAATLAHAGRHCRLLRRSRDPAGGPAPVPADISWSDVHGFSDAKRMAQQEFECAYRDT